MDVRDDDWVAGPDWRETALALLEVIDRLDRLPTNERTPTLFRSEAARFVDAGESKWLIRITVLQDVLFRMIYDAEEIANPDVVVDLDQLFPHAGRLLAYVSVDGSHVADTLNDDIGNYDLEAPDEVTEAPSTARWLIKQPGAGNPIVEFVAAAMAVLTHQHVTPLLFSHDSDEDVIASWAGDGIYRLSTPVRPIPWTTGVATSSDLAPGQLVVGIPRDERWWQANAQIHGFYADCDPETTGPATGTGTGVVVTSADAIQCSLIRPI